MNAPFSICLATHGRIISKEESLLMITTDFKIETSRLILRPFTENDGEAMLRIQDNPIMTRYTPDETWKGIEDAYEFLKFAQWLYTDDPNRPWFRIFLGIMEKLSDNLIGYCGLGNPEFNAKLVEVFYSVDCPYWGRGYATETAQALLNYGFRELKLDKIVGFAEKENLASIRVLEKIGLKRNGEISGLPERFSYFNGEPFFELRHEEWRYIPELF
jgi:ribosomal-protein-alanine N-acetyltransferase